MVKIVLRPLKISDIDNVMTWVNDPEVVKNLQHFNKKFTRKNELEFIKKLISSDRDYAFSIFRKVDNVYLGQGSINQIARENKLGRLSLIIKKEFWGQGYGQQAIKLLLRFAFLKLKLNKIWLMIYATNRKGLRLYPGFGFKKEGLLQKEYFWNGKYHDIVRMGMLRSDFLRRSKHKLAV